MGSMTALFVTVWVSAAALFVLAVSHTRVSIFRVSSIQIFLVLAFVMSFLGYPILYFQLDDYRVATGITDKVLLVNAMVASAWAIIGTMVSYALLDSVSFGGPSRSKSRHGQSLPSVGTATISLVFWFVVIAVCVLVAFVYLSRTEEIALFQAALGGDVAAARSSMTNDFPGRYHWYRLFFQDIMWIASLVLYAIALSGRSALLWVAFLLSCVLSAFFLTMTAQKAPIVFFFFTILLVHVYMNNRGLISKRQVAIVGAAALVVLLFMYYIFMGAGGVSSALSSVGSRALTGQLSGAYNYQWIFPEHLDYLFGRSFPNPGGVLPFESYSLTKEVMAMAHPHLAERGIVGSQPTMFWGEAYANFGWLGVLVAPLYVGSYIFLWKWCLGFIRTEPLRAAGTVWIGLQLGQFAFSGLGWSLMPVTLVAGFLLLITADRLARVKVHMGRMTDRKMAGTTA